MSIIAKWHGILAPNCKLKWGDVLDGSRNMKEIIFSWSIWNKSIAINTWRARFIEDIDDKCHMCNDDTLETIQCRFWDCRVARIAWNLPLVSFTWWKWELVKRGPGNHWDGTLGSLEKKFPSTWQNLEEFTPPAKASYFGLFRWKETISPLITTCGFQHNEANNLGKVYFEYAMVAWDMAGKDAYKTIIYDDMLGNYEKTCDV